MKRLVIVVLALVASVPLLATKADSNTPWRGEETVYVRNHTIATRWDPAIVRMTDELNTLTQYMPHAPTFVYVNDNAMTCDQMMEKRSGINVCTFALASNGGWSAYWDNFWAAGCPVCAAGETPKRVWGDLEDGWVSRIYLENTDSDDITPENANKCGRDHNLPCGAAWDAGDSGFNIVSHEFGHSALGLGHVDGSTTRGIHPWGPADFDRAESWFGQSKKNGADWEFCDIYPNGFGCPAPANPPNPEFGGPGQPGLDD